MTNLLLQTIFLISVIFVNYSYKKGKGSSSLEIISQIITNDQEKFILRSLLHECFDITLFNSSRSIPSIISCPIIKKIIIWAIY